MGHWMALMLLPSVFVYISFAKFEDTVFHETLGAKEVEWDIEFSGVVRSIGVHKLFVTKTRRGGERRGK